MNKYNTNIGVELLFVLTQQRYLYYQLKMLADRQQQLAGTSSPELLLEVIAGRRKLIEEFRDLNDKLRPIKANWQKLICQVRPEHKAQVHKMINQTHEIIGQISAVSPFQTTQNFPLHHHWKFDELVAEINPVPSQNRVPFDSKDCA